MMLDTPGTMKENYQMSVTNHPGDVVMAGIVVGANIHVIPTLAVVLPIVWFSMEIVIHIPELIDTIKGLFTRWRKK